MMDDRRRLSFGRAAELYDRRRPSYPTELVDDVIALAGGTPLRALEIGAGTGKATVLFAQRGVTIDAVEPSPGMAATLRANLAQHPNVTVVEREFESLDRPEEPYGLLYSAQAWHWIDPARRYELARGALGRGGVLAAFWNRDEWDGNPLQDALDDVYRTLAPELFTDGRPRTGGNRGSAVPAVWEAEIAGAEGFAGAEVRLYPWRAAYTAREYAELLATHSDHAVLHPDRRAKLLDAVARVIDAAGGELRLDYVTRLFLARAV
jgi:SAM-dependent methyltransferase